MMRLQAALCVLLLLLPLASLQYDRDSVYPVEEGDDALELLRTIKRRVASQLEKEKTEAAGALTKVKRRLRKKCRDWNDPCVPWSSNSAEACCNPRRLICRCNLWMQNCRCVSRAWGK